MQTTHHLDVFELTLATIREMRELIANVARVDRSLGDQLRRAAQSIALNIAEAGGSTRGNRRNRLESALGSAREARACLAVADAFGYVELASLANIDRALDRICARLYGMLRVM